MRLTEAVSRRHQRLQAESARIAADTLVQISQDLTANRPFLAQFLLKILESKKLTIISNMKTEESYTDMIQSTTGDTYQIQIGVKTISSKIAQRIMFLHRTFSEQEEIQYKLLHEIAHVWLNELIQKNNPEAQTLLNICKAENERTGLFFTGRASFGTERIKPKKANYALPDDMSTVSRAEEDAVELICMTLWSISYVEAFMRYLSNPDFRMEREKLKIRSLNTEEIKVLLELLLSIAKTNPLQS